VCPDAHAPATLHRWRLVTSDAATTPSPPPPPQCTQDTIVERERKDCLLLDSMLEAQQRLQACIMDTFGMGQ
jgi:hypothetical protein